jgi:hypothetical protein
MNPMTQSIDWVFIFDICEYGITNPGNSVQSIPFIRSFEE